MPTVQTDETLSTDIVNLASSQAFDSLDGGTLLVTGATGLIGSLLVRAALYRNRNNGGVVRVVALARDADKAARMFKGFPEGDQFRILIGDVTQPLNIDEHVDWISHGASFTSSAAFARQPVEVALTELEGTRNILEFARGQAVKGLVYLSSLEVYGDVPQEHGDVLEADEARLDRLVPRNSYPAAKRMCESLCAAYASEYGVPAKIARLAQTFGAGVALDDQRVFAQFARAVIEGEPITLHTPGQGCRSYCYTSDAVDGMLAVLTTGAAGEAYNVSNPRTYCSVREMAEMVVNRYRESGVKLHFDFPEDLTSFGFAAPSFVKLNSDKLMALGWKPQFDLPEMFDRLISSMSRYRG